MEDSVSLYINQMSTEWTSNLRRDLKEKLFLSTVESVLIYGRDTWTMTADKQHRWYIHSSVACWPPGELERSYNKYVVIRKPLETLRVNKTKHDEICGPLLQTTRTSN